MDAQGWTKLEEVFFGALECPEGERSAYLDRVCGDDSALRAEVEAVLDTHLKAELDDPRREVGSAGGVAGPAGADATNLQGTRLGPYLLDERIGWGGMAEVYRAHRIDEQYRQRVAVKLVRSSLPAAEMDRRFRLERQLLARLQHPNVATLLDGGVAPDGRPYLVMEFVDGVPVTEYADAQRLTLTERLCLFVEVCRTVQFAHANLVVHRDLKPSNILVTKEGRVRLLDFGIAKLLDPDSSEVTVPLTEELILLTPDHAAPEQVLGDAITTATDVYGLGVLLYELLAGTRPFRGVSPTQMGRAVWEREPARPSAAWTGRHDPESPIDPQEIAARRRTDPDQLTRALRKDLDAMVLMALRKEPERRYASALQFAEDVERYLEGRPVLAQGDRFIYRARKFVRRNRLSVATLCAFVLVLGVGAAAVLHQSMQKTEALRQAELERDTSTRLADFMVSVFEASDPDATRGRTVPARELLDRASQRLEKELADEPQLRADLALAMGRAYGGLGLIEASRGLFEQALNQRRGSAAADPEGLVEALEQAGRARAAAGEISAGIPLLEQAVELRTNLSGPESPEVAALWTTLGRMHADLGAFELAWELLGRAERVQREAEPRDIEALVRTLRFQFVVAEGLGMPPEQWLERTSEALTLAESHLDPDDPFLFNVREDYALTLQSVGEADSAVAVHRGLLADRERVFGPRHPQVAFSLFNLGRATGRTQGRWEESLPLLRRALEIREELYGPNHHLIAGTLHSLAVATAFSGDLAGASELEGRALRIHESAERIGHPDMLNVMEFQAQLKSLLGEHEVALDLVRRLLEDGWTNAGILQNQPFDSMRDLPRFRALVGRAAAMAGSPTGIG